MRDEVPHTAAPTITISNPPRGSITLYEGDPFNFRFQAQTGTPKKNISIKMDGSVIQSASVGESFVVPINTTGLSV